MSGYVVKLSVQLSLCLCEATVTIPVTLFPLTMVLFKYNYSPSSYFQISNHYFHQNPKVSSFKKLSSAMLRQVERSHSSSTRFDFALDFCSRFPVTCTTFQITFLVQQQLVTHVKWQFFATATLSHCKSCPTFSLFSFFFTATTFTTETL